jgi:hypothetical protein
MSSGVLLRTDMLDEVGMSQTCQEETSRAWLDYACVATVKVLRDVLTSANRDKRKLLKIAGG